MRYIFLWGLLAVMIHAVPNALNNANLVTNLEKFKHICPYYEDVFKDPHRIKHLCQVYDRKLADALKTGYRLDKGLPRTKHKHIYMGKEHICTEQVDRQVTYDAEPIERYRKDLMALSDLREEIIHTVALEKRKAREAYDVAYHEKLIRKLDKGHIYYYDKIFMSEHKEIYIESKNSWFEVFFGKDKEGNDDLEDARKKNYFYKERAKEQNLGNCSKKMTPELHYEEQSGALTARIIRVDQGGFIVESESGTLYFVDGITSNKKGDRLQSLPVLSKGLTKNILIKDGKAKSKQTIPRVQYIPDCKY